MKARRCRAVLLLAAAVLSGTAVGLGAQDATPRPDRPLRVFLDCATPLCSSTDVRQRITFLDYVNDREHADVHLIVTARPAGSGGFELTLDFLGRGEFEGLDDRLTVSTLPEEPEVVIATEVARMLELGLARYLARTPATGRFRLVHLPASRVPAGAEADRDLWNAWVFRVRGSGSVNGEEGWRSESVSATVAANRITEGLKVQLSLRGRYARDRFELTDSTTLTSSVRGLDGSGLVVWSLGGNWSVGIASTLSQSSFSNLDLSVRLAPAVEVNLYPYEESSRRQARLLYTVGATRNDYAEPTIFGRTAETRYEQSVVGSLDLKQDWGSASAAAQVSHFIQNPELNRIVLYGDLGIQLFRGLTLDLSGSASRIRDQINLPAGRATAEEILLLRRELQTDFRYFLSVGLGFTFGSIFSNVVNPRLNNPSGGFIQIY